MDQQVAGLVHAALGSLVPVFLLGIRALRRKFALSEGLPTIHEGLIVLLMGAVGFALAYGDHSVTQTIPAATIIDVPWVQGLLIWIAFILGDVAADATSIKTEGAAQKLRAMRVLPFILAAGLLGSPGVARAETPMLSLDRFAAGPRAFAQVYDFDDGRPREFGFALGAAGSYNLTSRWNADGSIERKFNAGLNVPAQWRASGGLDVKLPGSTETSAYYLAFERAWYQLDKGWSPGQWVVRVQWSFGAQDKSGHDYGFATVRGRYDVPDANATGRRDIGVGVTPQLIGGK